MKKATIFLVVAAALVTCISLALGVFFGRVVLDGKNFPSGASLYFNKVIYLPNFDMNVIAANPAYWSGSKLIDKYHLARPKRIDWYSLEKKPLISIIRSNEMIISEPSVQDILYRYESDEKIRNIIDTAVASGLITITELEYAINGPSSSDVDIRKKLSLTE